MRGFKFQFHTSCIYIYIYTYLHTCIYTYIYIFLFLCSTWRWHLRPKHVVENNGIHFCVLFRFIVILIVKKQSGGRNTLRIKVLNSYVFNQLVQIKPEKSVIRKPCFKRYNRVSFNWCDTHDKINSWLRGASLRFIFGR